jgi:hypothetical protein
MRIDMSKPKPKNTSTAKALPTKREPHDHEKEAIKRSWEQIMTRPVRPSVAFDPQNKNSFVARHSDEDGVVVHRCNDAFATESNFVDAVFSGQLEVMTRQRGADRGDSNTDINAGLAIVASVEPRNELEAALAVQMAGAHTLATEMLGKARHTTDMNKLERYGNLAVKLQRTFAAQLEALAKLRGGGKQTVEVKHTYVDARGSQNVIAETVTTGGGQKHGNSEQPHEHLLGHAPGAPVAPVWSEEPAGQSVSGSGHTGKDEVQATRG